MSKRREVLHTPAKCHKNVKKDDDVRAKADSSTNKKPVVAVLAGRRPDEADADVQRFPSENVQKVKRLLQQEFSQHGITNLVCSAACGADLIALEVAIELGIETQIILPFPADKFKQSSVVDRAGNWGELFDNIITELENNLQTLNYLPDDLNAYLNTNIAMLSTAEQLATNGDAVAFVVWDGIPKDSQDATNHFLQLASNSGMEVIEVSTL